VLDFRKRQFDLKNYILREVNSNKKEELKIIRKEKKEQKYISTKTM